LVGATLESMQVWDILRSVDYLIDDQKLPIEKLSVYGRGDTGILGMYAAILDQRISRVVLDDPPTSHRQGPALLNILRFTDLPGTAALIAPREIVSLTRFPDSFGYTARILALRQQTASLRQASGLTKALQ